MIQLKSDRFKQCFYQKQGNGFPVILLHGFGEHSGIFKYQTGMLSGAYTLLIPDLPGSGRSQLPEEEMSMELLAEFVYEIIESEGYEKVILAGHSMGGYATLAFAAKYPDKLAGFALLHSTAYADDEAKKENRKKSVRLIQRDGKEVFLKAMIPNLYSETSKENKPDEILFHLTIAMELSSDSLVAYTKAMIRRQDHTSVLKDNELPVLFVIGKEDNLIPYTDMLTQSAMPHTGMAELLEGTGHTGMLECPEKVNEVLNNFCKYVLHHKIA